MAYSQAPAPGAPNELDWLRNFYKQTVGGSSAQSQNGTQGGGLLGGMPMGLASALGGQNGMDGLKSLAGGGLAGSGMLNGLMQTAQPFGLMKFLGQNNSLGIGGGQGGGFNPLSSLMGMGLFGK